MDPKIIVRAIVLAGGESRRMGRMKMLLPFNGTTMLEQVIENIRNAGLSDVTVVAGFGREKLIPVLENINVNYCVNENYAEGMLSSVICGMRSIKGDYGYMMIFQGDQPLISSETIRRMIGESGKTSKGMLIPVHGDKRGHPLMVSRQLANKIEFLDPSVGLKALTVENPEEILEVSVNDPGILKDFDTYDEYLREINQTM